MEANKKRNLPINMFKDKFIGKYIAADSGKGPNRLA